eukprot:COSAG02_NODE_863_length_16409_cov_16.571613_4_plen_221_part_00
MFFTGSDTELLDRALSPLLATWHYFFVVVMTPLIMLNLLIALMGGSYERIEQNTKNAMRRQKAELLVSLEVLMSDEDKRNDQYFPRWLFWYRPAERQAEGTTYENGVINGVKRMLDQQTQEQSKEAIDVRAQVQEQLSQMGEKMEQDLAQRDTKMEQDLAQISSKVCQIEQDLAQRDTKMEQELAQLNANVKQIEKSNAAMLQELSSRFEEVFEGRRDGD